MIFTKFLKNKISIKNKICKKNKFCKKNKIFMKNKICSYFCKKINEFIKFFVKKNKFVMIFKIFIYFYTKKNQLRFKKIKFVISFYKKNLYKKLNL